MAQISPIKFLLLLVIRRQNHSLACFHFLKTTPLTANSVADYFSVLIVKCRMVFNLVSYFLHRYRLLADFLLEQFPYGFYLVWVGEYLFLLGTSGTSRIFSPTLVTAVPSDTLFAVDVALMIEGSSAAAWIHDCCFS